MGRGKRLVDRGKFRNLSPSSAAGERVMLRCGGKESRGRGKLGFEVSALVELGGG